MPLTNFSPATAQRIGFYVYALADDQDRIFYIGKGIGNRVFDHVNAVREAVKAGVLPRPSDQDQQRDDGPESEGLLSEKQDTIARLLQDDGPGPSMYIIREGLQESEALMLESVLISVLDWQLEGALTNVVAGHGTRRLGLKTIEELEATHGEPFRISDLPDAAKLVGKEIVAININRRWHEVTRQAQPLSLLEVSRGDWKVSLARIQKCRYAVIHSNGIVRGVFEVATWQPVQGRPNRFFFEPVGQAPLQGAQFANKNASSLFGACGTASQYPIRYSKVPGPKGQQHTCQGQAS